MVASATLSTVIGRAGMTGPLPPPSPSPEPLPEPATSSGRRRGRGRRALRPGDAVDGDRQARCARARTSSARTGSVRGGAVRLRTVGAGAGDQADADVDREVQARASTSALTDGEKPFGPADEDRSTCRRHLRLHRGGSASALRSVSDRRALAAFCSALRLPSVGLASIGPGPSPRVAVAGEIRCRSRLEPRRGAGCWSSRRAAARPQIHLHRRRGPRRRLLPGSARVHLDLGPYGCAPRVLHARLRGPVVCHVLGGHLDAGLEAEQAGSFCFFRVSQSVLPKLSAPRVQAAPPDALHQPCVHVGDLSLRGVSRVSGRDATHARGVVAGRPARP